MRILLAFVAIAGFIWAQGQPVQLFNGKDLTGWQMVGPGRFLIEDGLLKTEGGMGLLWYTGRKVGNETLRVVFKTTGDRDNSGVYIRMPEPPPDPWYGVHNGYEVQIDAAGDEWHRTGALYSLSRSTKATQEPAGEWNTMDIVLDGQLTRVILNGEVVNEFRGDQAVPERKMWFEPVRGPRPNEGYIGLQNHDPRTTVYFKEVSVFGSQAVPDGERNRLLSYLHATRKQVLDTVAKLSPAQLNYKPAPEKWSIAEVVEHLTLTEPFLMKYALAFVDQSAPAPADSKLTTDQLVDRMRDRSKPATAPVEIRPTGKLSEPVDVAFRTARDRTLDFVRTTREPLMKRWGKAGPDTVAVWQILWMIPGHTERHLAQIEEVRKSPGFPAR